MRFAGCCNISCKRIDAVEHSDDLGASRKGRNLPTSENDKHHADAVQACAENRLRLFYEASIEGLDMDSHSGRLVPPERHLEGSGKGAFFRLFALATPGTQAARPPPRSTYVSAIASPIRKNWRRSGPRH